MKKLFTIILVLAVFASFGQRTSIQADQVLSVPSIGLQKDAHLDTILPGNWATAQGAVTYTWTDMGYIFGTNGYGDAGYGQRFNVTEPYEIVKAIFWIGAKAGTTGNVVFTIWDFSGAAPGDVIASVTVPFADIVASETFEGAFVVEFDEPVLVSANYLMGADISGLGAWTAGTYGMGNVSSNEDNGTQLGYAYALEGTQWVPVLNYDVDVDIAIFPLVQVPGETYAVTFNVDMGGATGFDPEVHEVWLTGNFTGWAEPGETGSVQLFPAPPAKEATVIYEEGFEPANDTGALPDGWTQKKANNAIGNALVDLATGDRQWIRFSEQYYPYETYNAAWTRTGAASMHINWNVEAEQNVYAITPEIELPAAADMTLEFWMYFSSAYHTELNVLLELDGTWEVLTELNSTAHANLYESAVTLDLTGKVGTARIAFVYKWTDGIQMNIDDISIYGTVGEPEELIYTATADVPEGELLYKYFSDAFGAGWDGGEWAGDPNRSVMVTGDLVLNDTWGVQPPVSVDEIQLDMVTRVYPNPVRNTLFIQSDQQIDHLRMFDLAGRMVYQSQVMDFETTIDANQLRGGLYILQMISGQQVKTHKIQVVK